jgi:deferrochelatase/peroxidase EfeB
MPDITRRRFLQAGLITGAGAALASAGGVAAAAATSAGPFTSAHPDGALTSAAGAAQASSFDGPHQLTPLSEPTRATAFVAFDVVAADAKGLKELLQVVTDRARLLYAGGAPVDLGPAAPTDDNGILGPTTPAHQVAFVLGLGASLFDDRFGLAGRRPARLTTMGAFPNDNLDPAQLHGDLSIQIGAADADTVAHALRDITKHTRGAMQPRWKVDAFSSPPRPNGTPRNLLGFKDGISNPGVTEASVLDDLIWVRPGAPEPAWTVGGTYLVVRIIRELVEFWDRVSLNEQENMIGRRRASGAPLDANDEFDSPNYPADPQGNVIRLDAHIRLANPRTPSTAAGRILRRGYNYDRGIDVNGNLDQGLLFTCYQQDIQRQFETTQKRLIDEPLADYISPVGGGYFYVPPGVNGTRDHFASGLFVPSTTTS